MEKQVSSEQSVTEVHPCKDPEPPVIPPADVPINILNREGVVILRNVEYVAGVTAGQFQLLDAKTRDRLTKHPTTFEKYGKFFRVLNNKNRRLCWSGWKWEYFSD